MPEGEAAAPVAAAVVRVPADDLSDEEFANGLLALPGDSERLPELSSREPRKIRLATVNGKQRVVSRGIMQALEALVDGKARNIVKAVQESGNSAHMIESEMDSKPADDEDFGSWYYNWLELVRQTEDVRQKALDALKTAPKELRDHLVLESHVIGDDFSKMNQIVTTWMTARRL